MGKNGKSKKEFISYLSKYKWVLTALIILISTISAYFLLQRIYIQIVDNVTLQQVPYLIDTFRLIISWPVVFIAFLLLFKSPLSTFITNIRFIKAQGFEAEIQKEEQPNTQEAVADSVTLTKEEVLQIKEIVDAKDQDIQSKIEEIGDKDKVINYLVALSEINEFMYLNLYLVPNTKLHLSWVNNQGGMAKEMFYSSAPLAESYGMSIPTNMEQKSVIYSTLRRFELITVTDDFIKVTEKGIRFLQFIGLHQ